MKKEKEGRSPTARRPAADDAAKVAEYRKTLGRYPKPSVTADIIAVRPAYSELGEGQPNSAK